MEEYQSYDELHVHNNKQTIKLGIVLMYVATCVCICIWLHVLYVLWKRFTLVDFPHMHYDIHTIYVFIYTYIHIHSPFQIWVCVCVRVLM